MDVDEIEIQPNVPLSMKPSEKPKMIMRSILVCSVCAAFILGWAGYTLFEVVFEFREEKKELYGVASLLIRNVETYNV